MLDRLSRNRIRRLNGGLALALGLAAALPGFAAVPWPVGEQFQINSYTTNAQTGARIAADSGAGFVVVWTSDGSFGTDTSGSSIQGQRYLSGGSPQGAQFQVNAYTTLAQHSPSVAMAPNGDFVVVWESFRSSGTDTSFASIQGRRFASNGSAQGAQFQVNSYTTDYQRDPAVATSPNGDFVVVWTSRGSPGTDSSFDSIQGQRYASDGAAQGAQFQVNTFTTSYQRFGSVVAEPDGDFVVAWTSYGSFQNDHDGDSIQVRRYASDGSAQGAQFQVNTTTLADQFSPSIAADSDGGFLVVWAGNSRITGRRYDSAGSSLGDQFQLSSPTGGLGPSVAAAPNGDFLGAWSADGSSGTDTFSTSIQGRGIGSNGSPQGAQFQINTYTQYGQIYPNVAATSDAEFVVVWSSYRATPGNDTTTFSVQGQRFSMAAQVPALSLPMSLALAVALLLSAGFALRRR